MTNYDELFWKKSGYAPDQVDFTGNGVHRFDTPFGFFVVALGRKDFVVVAMCGNGDRLIPFVEQQARELGYSKLSFETKRPRAFERKWGYKPVATVMEKEL